MKCLKQAIVFDRHFAGKWMQWYAISYKKVEESSIFQFHNGDWCFKANDETFLTRLHPSEIECFICNKIEFKKV
jgi:hypothetical protein